ncbi:MAG TPA: hypothetical protein VF375_01185 [Candidatus Limnocylindrales bacterium]
MTTTTGQADSTSWPSSWGLGTTYAWNGPATLSWRRPIDSWLAEIGFRVFADVPYRLGLIGHEVSGDEYAEELADAAARRRDIGYLIPSNGSVTYEAGDR